MKKETLHEEKKRFMKKRNAESKTVMLHVKVEIILLMRRTLTPLHFCFVNRHFPILVLGLPVTGNNQSYLAPNFTSCPVLNLSKSQMYDSFIFKLDSYPNCQSESVIYVPRCYLCSVSDNTQLNFGQACNRFHMRSNGHRACFKTDSLLS